MEHYKTRLFLLMQDKLAYTEMANLGVDCTEELAALEATVAGILQKIEVAKVIDHYKVKKRWRTGLTAEQKELAKARIKRSTHSIVERISA